MGDTNPIAIFFHAFEASNYVCFSFTDSGRGHVFKLETIRLNYQNGAFLSMVACHDTSEIDRQYRVTIKIDYSNML